MRKNPTQVSVWSDAIKHIIDSLSKPTWKQIGKAFVICLLSLIIAVLTLTLFYFYNYLNRKFNQQAIEKTMNTTLIANQQRVDSLKVEEEIEIFKKTDEVERNLQNRSFTLRENLDADRTTISVFHNGTRSSGGVDFRYFDEDYEYVAESRGIQRISSRCKNIKTSDYPLMNYLRFKKKLFIAHTNEIAKIDPGYADKLRLEDYEYVAFYYLTAGDDLPLGIITASWKKDDLSYAPDSTTLANKMLDWGEKIEPEMQLSFYLKMKNKVINKN
jgi:hypothetical protein